MRGKVAQQDRRESGKIWHKEVRIINAVELMGREAGLN